MTSDSDPVELGEGPEIGALRAELEASLQAGLLPNGWEHRVQWSADPHTLHPVATAVFIAGSSGGATLAWGWKAGVAALLLSIGLRMVPSVRGGPRPGQRIEESFIPPEEKREIGIAGHTLASVSRSRPGFYVERIATRDDRRSVRRGAVFISVVFVMLGSLTLLEESRVIGPVTYLRASAVLGAVACVGFAVWIWRVLGALVPLPDAARAADDGTTVDDVLSSATTGSTTDAVSEAVLSRLPLAVHRVLTPALALAVGALGLLVAFNATPDQDALWSGLAATTELVVFVGAAIRAVLSAAIGLLRGDAAALRSSVGSLLLMGVLLLIARLFGWLDDWGDVVHWFGELVG
jgi:hypothetical protein